jgi:DNA-binding PadR family transcriptional regulator
MMDHVRKSNLVLAILGLVSITPLSGYDLRKIFTTTPMGHFSTSPGAIYPALRRLERRGLTKGTVKNANTLRPKQTFAITRKGLILLKEILSQPVTLDDVKWNLDGLLLRFAFMGTLFGKQTALDFLWELAAKTDAYVVTLQAHLERTGAEMDATARYAQEHGIDQYRTTSAWAKRTMKELAGK